MKHYDWKKTFSYQTGNNGEFCLVLGAKNIGKTFGLRLELINRFLKTGKQFCEICRTKDEAEDVADGYMDKLFREGFFKGYQYKTTKRKGYIGKVELDDDGNEVVNEWRLFVYFVALTMFQREKKRTYDNVYYFIFDEAVIDRKDKVHRYLHNEFSILANLIDTILREDWENPKGAKCFLLGNSCDLLCPYLRGLGINTLPDYGFAFYNNKQTLLHYVKGVDVEEKIANTFVGRMLAGSEEARLVFNNEFLDDNDSFIEKRISSAAFKFGIKYMGTSFGVWLDWQRALFYVEGRIPKNHESQTLALTRSDNTINYVMVSKTDDALKLLLEAFYLQSIRYDSPATRELFFQFLGYFGIS